MKVTITPLYRRLLYDRNNARCAELMPWIQSLTPQELAEFRAVGQHLHCENCNCHYEAEWHFGDIACMNCGCREPVSAEEFEQLKTAFEKRASPNTALRRAYSRYISWVRRLFP